MPEETETMRKSKRDTDSKEGHVCVYLSLQALKINQAVEIEESKTHRGHFYINRKVGGVGGVMDGYSVMFSLSRHGWS